MKKALPGMPIGILAAAFHIDGVKLTSCNDNRGDSQGKEQGGKNNRHPKQRFLNTAACCEYTARIAAGQATQAGALTLQDDSNHQGDCRYNQSNIKNLFNFQQHASLLGFSRQIIPVIAGNSQHNESMMHELITNLHMHTIYSDGSGTYATLAAAAIKTGVDVLLVTDHNVRVQGVDGYFTEGEKRVLVLACEEIHDQGRNPQKNHLLVFGADRELASFAESPQKLITAARAAGGLSFIAHPVDPALPVFGEGDISWVDWQVRGFTGIELWNGFSELKVVIKHRLDGLFYAYFPEFIARGPIPETLHIWDDLLSKGQRVVAVGGSDAHARKMSMGPVRRTIFPYEYHFSAINTHILTPTPPTGELASDRKMVFDALEAGHCFIGYDLPARTTGFRFTAQGRETEANMGDEIPVAGGVTLQVKLPAYADECRLLKDGKSIRKMAGEACAQIINEPGVYRVEAYRNFLGRLRGWIFSNPIYVR